MSQIALCRADVSQCTLRLLGRGDYKVPELRILLKRDHANYEQIAGGIRKNLDELESVKTEEIREPQQPGTLVAEWTQITEFAIKHADKIAEVAKAVIEMATAVILLRGAQKGESKSDKPVVLKSGDAELALPASEQKKKQFLAEITGKKRAKSKARKEAKNAGEKQPKKRGRD